MRIGQNPAKFVESVPSPARVTAVVITYIPFLGGYYEHSLDVLKDCLASMRMHTEAPFDLLVFDNASCAEVREYLQAEQAAGRIQYLVFSGQNLGKAGAWNFAFGAAPGEIIAYADADIYFETGWLEALLAVIDAYPEAGMVTGMPMWSPAAFCTATVAWAESTEGVSLRRGKLLSWQDYWTHARSLGQSEAEARANFDGQVDLLFEDSRPSNSRLPSTAAGSRSGGPAGPSTFTAQRAVHLARFFIGAGHFQFLARKTALQSVLPIPADRPMGQVRRLDAAINAASYLRLSTPDWWVRHLGNTPHGLTGMDAAPPAKSRRRPLRALAQWIYHRAFDYLYKP